MQALLEGFLTEAELGEALGKTQRTLRGWRQRGIGPPYTRMGQTVIYGTESFRAWLKAGEQPVRSPRKARVAARAATSARTIGQMRET
jgi:hypothetical protein